MVQQGYTRVLRHVGIQGARTLLWQYVHHELHLGKPGAREQPGMIHIGFDTAQSAQTALQPQDSLLSSALQPQPYDDAPSSQLL
jgi:hypothetical protein